MGKHPQVCFRLRKVVGHLPEHLLDLDCLLGHGDSMLLCQPVYSLVRGELLSVVAKQGCCDMDGNALIPFGIFQVGWVLGQALDIKAESSKKKISIEKIKDLQSFKTGKLISWSCEVGAILSEEDRSPFKTFASCIGLAFQIQDDILDVTGTSKILGKKAGKDKSLNKATFVSNLGLDGAVKKNKNLVEEACDALTIFGDKADNLRQISHFIINRKN